MTGVLHARNTSFVAEPGAAGASAYPPTNVTVLPEKENEISTGDEVAALTPPSGVLAVRPTTTE